MLKVNKQPLAVRIGDKRMKTRHDGDCSIYASLSNISMPEAGICTCGFAHQEKIKGDGSEDMYSRELEEKMLNE